MNNDNLFSTKVTIVLDFVNPPDNRPGQSFQIYTYQDAEMLFLMDQLVTGMEPRLLCDYPCATCSELNRKMCTSCW